MMNDIKHTFVRAGTLGAQHLGARGWLPGFVLLESPSASAGVLLSPSGDWSLIDGSRCLAERAESEGLLRRIAEKISQDV